MIPSNFDESNCVLDKPPELTVDECDCLSVFRGTDSNNFPIVISCWKLTKEELERVNKTGRIYLGVIGDTMPPVWLDGMNPFRRPHG